MLNSIILRLIARSSDSIVAFFVGLDAKLDIFLQQHDAEVAAFEQEIIDIKDETVARISVIEAEGEAAVKAVEDTISEKAKTAKILLGLKGALPTA